jgi:hypothetical protein
MRWRADEEGTFAVPLRFVPSGIRSAAGRCDDYAFRDGASIVGRCRNCGYRRGVRCSERKGRITMAGMWLYILGIAVAGYIVYKFVPGNK